MPAGGFDHRPADHAGLGLHQGHGRALGLDGLLLRAELAPGGALGIEQALPAGGLAPFVELGRGDAGFLVVVEGVGHAMFVQPGEGLLHGVAVLRWQTENKYGRLGCSIHDGGV